MLVEVDGGVLRKFNGGYSSYLEQKSTNFRKYAKDHENLLRMVKEKLTGCNMELQQEEKEMKEEKLNILI